MFCKYWIRAGWPHTDCLNTIICCTRNHIPVVQSIARHFPEWTFQSHTQNGQHMLIHYWLFSLDHCRLLLSDWYCRTFWKYLQNLHKTDVFVFLTFKRLGWYLNFRILFLKNVVFVKENIMEKKAFCWQQDRNYAACV